MAIQLIGDTSFKELPDSAGLTEDNEGKVTLSRVYEGLRDDYPAFLQSMAKGSGDAQYSGLFVNTKSVACNGPIARVTVNFTGGNEGLGEGGDDPVEPPAPYVVITEDLVIESFEAETQMIASDGSPVVPDATDPNPICLHYYYAPTLNARFSSKTRPKAPLYSGLLPGSLSLNRVIRTVFIEPPTEIFTFENRTLGDPVSSNSVIIQDSYGASKDAASTYWDCHETSRRVFTG